MSASKMISNSARRLGRIAMKLGVLLLIVMGFGLRYVLHSRLSAAAARTVDVSGTQMEKGAPEVTMWTCAMHPQIRQPRAGRCLICGMDLVPVAAESEDEGDSMRRFSTSAAARALMEIEISPVERRSVTTEIRMVGKVEYDETTLGHITAWVPGRLDRLHVDYTGVEVKKGDPMADIYSPDLISAQEELLQAITAARELESSEVGVVKETTESFVEAARDRLRLWGLSREQVEEIENRGSVSDHVTLNAPMSGVVIDKNAQEGTYVSTGARIYTIARLDEVWVKLDAYESDLVWLRNGQTAEFSTEAYPGDVFTGQIAFIDPVLNEKTRTVKVRVNVPNAEGKLKPGMFVRGVVRADVASSAVEATKPLVIPATAALVTGTRAIVYVEVPEADRPTFEGREIVLGPRAGDYYIVRNGVEEGELVVTNGNFKIDSALQIQAKPSMMTPEGGAGGAVHQHGRETPKAAGEQSEHRLQAPAEFLDQLRHVEGAYLTVSDAVGSGDLAQTRGAFADFGKALDAVNDKLLKGHARMVWGEISMLLKNDAAEGRDAKTLKEAQRVLAGLTKNIKRLRKEFGTGHARDETRTSRSLEVPAEFQTQLGKLWKEYQAIQSSLAGDDFTGAARGVKSGLQALRQVDMNLLEGEAHMAWMKQGDGIEKALKLAEAAKDIVALREGFANISEAFLRAIKTFGTDAAGPIYRLHCPMAFGGRGGSWLQSDRETRNPYFGAAMLKCGEVVETIPSAEPRPAGEHHHE